MDTIRTRIPDIVLASCHLGVYGSRRRDLVSVSSDQRRGARLADQSELKVAAFVAQAQA